MYLRINISHVLIMSACCVLASCVRLLYRQGTFRKEFLLPANELQEGNVFSHVCLVCPFRGLMGVPCDHYLNLFKLVHFGDLPPGPAPSPSRHQTGNPLNTPHHTGTPPSSPHYTGAPSTPLTIQAHPQLPSPYRGSLALALGYRHGQTFSIGPSDTGARSGPLHLLLGPDWKPDGLPSTERASYINLVLKFLILTIQTKFSIFT